METDNKKQEVEHFEESHPPQMEEYDRALYVLGSEEERKLVRKIDLHLFPMLWLMYVFNYLDRTNIGNAKVAGMSKELNMSATDYSTALSIFFVGYLLNEIPSNMLLSRSRPSIFLPGLMFVWGAMTIAVKGINSTGGLIALRFCLGVVEAGFFPGVMFLLSTWYKPFELAKRLAIFYTASLMSGAFGGLLAGAITTNLDGKAGVPGWKWLFIIEGVATCFLASIAVFILPDFPGTTKFLTEQERGLAITRLVTADNSGPKLSHKQAFMAAVKDWKTWLCTFGYMNITSAGTISYYFPTLMTTLGYTGKDSNYMTVPIYASVLVVVLIVGFSSDRHNEKPYHIMASCLLATISFVIVTAVENHTVRYIFTVFGGAGVWAATPLFLSYSLSQFKVTEQRAVSIAIVNGLGNLASVYGSYIWAAKDAPLYRTGWGVTAAFIFAGGITTGALRYLTGDQSKAFAEQEAADQIARTTGACKQQQLKEVDAVSV